MHHPALAIPSTQLRSHVQKTLDFAVHIAIRDISPIFAPLAREDTLRRGIRWHGRDRWIADEGEAARLVEPCTAAAAGGEELVLEWSVDDADGWTVLHDEADRDAEHGENVGVIDGSWDRVRYEIAGCGVALGWQCTVEWIDTPGWLLVDQVIA